jgi:hypothetical protein
MSQPFYIPVIPIYYNFYLNFYRYNYFNNKWYEFNYHKSQVLIYLNSFINLKRL